MLDPTLDFTLIPFADVAAAAFSTSRIDRAHLKNSRIVFARTSAGNFAKMQLRGGNDLRIGRLVVYGPSGCIVRTAGTLVIRGGHGCDLDTVAEVASGGDFGWAGATPAAMQLQPRGGAAFFLCPGFEDVTPAQVLGAEYSPRRVDRSALIDQVLFCRTSAGRLAKLQVQAGDTLTVRRMVVYRADGTLHLDRVNLTLAAEQFLDVDTGTVGVSGDLWWSRPAPDVWFLAAANGARLSYPSYYRMEKHVALLTRPAIRAALVWKDGAGERAYDDWPESDRLMLNEFLHLRETDREPPLDGPPALTQDTYISACDAKKIYLSHVSHSLWVDAGGRVPWRLSRAGKRHLEYLFDVRRLLHFSPGKGYSFNRSLMGWVTQWNPSFAFAFLRDAGMIGDTQWKTILAVTEWVRVNLRHIRNYTGDFPSQAAQWEYLFGYRGPPPVERMLEPLPEREYLTQGCWGTSGFFAAVLRTVNIPVAHGRSPLGPAKDEKHSRPEFFSVGRALAHGDDPYERGMRTGHNTIPVDRIFYDMAELKAQIDEPAVPKGKTLESVASANRARRMAALHVEFLPDYLLHLRCLDRVPGVVPGTELKKHLGQFYTQDEIHEIAAACDREISQIPGGCPTLAFNLS